LDGQALFYLESRGIAPADAKKLLLRAFVGSVFDDIADEGERMRVEAAAQTALERMLDSSLSQREREGARSAQPSGKGEGR
jgi:Fe-S cluster assembly protein SufD